MLTHSIWTFPWVGNMLTELLFLCFLFLSLFFNLFLNLLWADFIWLFNSLLRCVFLLYQPRSKTSIFRILPFSLRLILNRDRPHMSKVLMERLCQYVLFFPVQKLPKVIDRQYWLFLPLVSLQRLVGNSDYIVFQVLILQRVVGW